MGGLLGLLAGCGMLMLIGVLLLRFLQSVRLLSRENVRQIVRCFGTTVAAGSIYLLCGLLLRQAVYLDVSDAADYKAYFHSPYLDGVYQALERPASIGPATDLFLLIARAAGTLLFSQPLSGGLLTAWGMTGLSVCLVFFRVRKLYGAEAGRDAAFLLLCLPGAIFFFLPGRAPLLLLLASCLFFFLGKKLRPRPFSLSGVLRWLLPAFSGLLSAFVAAGLALEWFR